MDNLVKAMGSFVDNYCASVFSRFRRITREQRCCALCTECIISPELSRQSTSAPRHQDIGMTQRIKATYPIGSFCLNWTGWISTLNLLSNLTKNEERLTATDLYL